MSAKGQITIPKSIRQQLGAEAPGTEVRFRSDGDVVLLERVGSDDPAIASFLKLLANDIAARPESVRTIGDDFFKTTDQLLSGMPDFNPDEEF